MNKPLEPQRRESAIVTDKKPSAVTQNRPTATGTTRSTKTAREAVASSGSRGSNVGPGEAGRLARTPGILIHGRIDLSSPVDVAWELNRAWPGSELIVVDEAGHGAGHRDMQEAVSAAIQRFRDK